MISARRQFVFRGLGAAQGGKILCNFSVVCLNSPALCKSHRNLGSTLRHGLQPNVRAVVLLVAVLDLMPMTCQADPPTLRANSPLAQIANRPNDDLAGQIGGGTGTRTPAAGFDMLGRPVLKLWDELKIVPRQSQTSSVTGVGLPTRCQALRRAA
jgi:hypothetical protein